MNKTKDDGTTDSNTAQNRTNKLYRQDKREQENLLKKNFNYICIPDCALALALALALKMHCFYHKQETCTHVLLDGINAIVLVHVSALSFVSAVTEYFCLTDYFRTSMNAQFLFGRFSTPLRTVISIKDASVFSTRRSRWHIVPWDLSTHTRNSQVNFRFWCEIWAKLMIEFNPCTFYSCYSQTQLNFVCIAVAGVPLVIISLRWLCFNSEFRFPFNFPTPNVEHKDSWVNGDCSSKCIVTAFDAYQFENEVIFHSIPYEQWFGIRYLNWLDTINCVNFLIEYISFSFAIPVDEWSSILITSHFHEISASFEM